MISIHQFITFSLLNSIAQAQLDYTKYGRPKKYGSFLNKTARLYDELFNKRDYNKALSPVFLFEEDEDETVNTTVTVHFKLWYLKMFYLDAATQVFSACFQFEQHWEDSRLIWDPIEFGGLKLFYVNTDKVWYPDNNIGNAKSIMVIQPPQSRLVTISNDGIVTTTTFYYAEISCQLNVDVFPFDKQVCSIPLMSLGYDFHYLTTNGSIDMKAIRPDSGNGEWEVTNISTSNYNYDNSTEVFNFEVHLKRVPNFYINVIALPCFILTLISIIGMFWTPNIRKEQLTKLSIGLTSLVSMTVLLDLLSGAIPKTSVFPLLGIYVILCVGIIAGACVAIVIFYLSDPSKRTENRHQKDNEKETQILPRQRIRSFMVDHLYHRHIFFQISFQILNLIGFIVFLSFWD